MDISHDATKSKYSRSGRLSLIIACYQLFIPAREDFSTFFKNAETKREKNVIVTGVASNTFFEKIPEGGVTFWGQKSDSQQWRDKNF